MIVGSVGALLLGYRFDDSRDGGDESDGEGVGSEHLLPRTAALHACSLESEHHGSGRILYVVIEMIAESGHKTIAQGTEMLVLAHLDESGGNEGHADIGGLHPAFAEEALALGSKLDGVACGISRCIDEIVRRQHHFLCACREREDKCRQDGKMLNHSGVDVLKISAKVIISVGNVGFFR